jgi:transposase
MATMQQERLRPLTVAEQRELTTITKASSERPDRVRRAAALLAVARGRGFLPAAREAGLRSGTTVSNLARRFNRVGLAALRIAAGRGRRPTYDPAARARIVATAQRPPDRRTDGTATWSLSTLERALRREGLPRVGATTIRRVLREAGSSYQRTRTWCPTGTAQRKRKAGVVRVVDPQTEGKRGPSSGPIASLKPPASPSGARMRPGRTRPFPGREQTGRRSAGRHGSRMSTSEAGRPSC